MKYNIRGDKMIVTDAINSYVEGKLGKLDKYFRNGEIKANVLLKVRGANRQIIEVTIPTEKFIIRPIFRAITETIPYPQQPITTGSVSFAPWQMLPQRKKLLAPDKR